MSGRDGSGSDFSEAPMIRVKCRSRWSSSRPWLSSRARNKRLASATSWRNTASLICRLRARMASFIDDMRLHGDSARNSPSATKDPGGFRSLARTSPTPWFCGRSSPFLDSAGWVSPPAPLGYNVIHE